MSTSSSNADAVSYVGRDVCSLISLYLPSTLVLDDTFSYYYPQSTHYRTEQQRKQDAETHQHYDADNEHTAKQIQHMKCTQDWMEEPITQCNHQYISPDHVHGRPSSSWLPLSEFVASGVALCVDGTIICTDYANRAIVHFTSTGQHIKTLPLWIDNNNTSAQLHMYNNPYCINTEEKRQQFNQQHQTHQTGVSCSTCSFVTVPNIIMSFSSQSDHGPHTCVINPVASLSHELYFVIDCWVLVCDIRTGQIIRRIHVDYDQVIDIAISDDGEWLLLMDQGKVQTVVSGAGAHGQSYDKSANRIAMLNNRLNRSGRSVAITPASSRHVCCVLTEMRDTHDISLAGYTKTGQLLFNVQFDQLDTLFKGLQLQPHTNTENLIDYCSIAIVAPTLPSTSQNTHTNTITTSTANTSASGVSSSSTSTETVPCAQYIILRDRLNHIHLLQINCSEQPPNDLSTAHRHNDDDDIDGSPPPPVPRWSAKLMVHHHLSCAEAIVSTSCAVASKQHSETRTLTSTSTSTSTSASPLSSMATSTSSREHTEAACVATSAAELVAAAADVAFMTNSFPTALEPFRRFNILPNTRRAATASIHTSTHGHEHTLCTCVITPSDARIANRFVTLHVQQPSVNYHHQT